MKARAKSYGNLTLAHTEHRNDDSSERDTRNKKTSPRPLMSVDIKMSKSVNGQHRDQTSKQPTNNKKKCSQQEPNKLSSSIGVPFAESFANNGSNGIITLNDVQQNDNLATKVMKDVPERVSQNKRQETLPSPSLAPNHLDSWEITRQQRLRNLGRDNRRPAAFLTEIHPEVDVLSKDHVVQMTMNEKGSVTEGAAVKTSSSSVLTRDNIETFLRYDPKLIKKYASKGSLTASIMQNAVEHALQALSVFITLDNWKSKGNVQRFLGESFVTYLAQAIRTEETVMNFPSSLKERMIVHVRQMLEAEMNSESQVDIDAKCCFAYLSMDSLEEIIAFLKGCSLKYKNEPCFHHRCGRLLGMLGRFEDGLSELNAALVLSQHRNCDLVYDRATMLRFIGCIKTDFNVVILAYNGFLKWAPADHRKVPESYYAMATIEIQKREIFKQEAGHLLSNDFDNDLSTVKEYYVKGLVAEQRQLPFLLSYHSKCKTFLEQYFSSINRTFCNSEPHPLQPSLI